MTSTVDQAEKVFGLLSETIIYPLHRNFQLQEEKSRCEVDYSEFASSSINQLEELLHEAAYGENTPLGGSLYANSIDDINAEESILFRNREFNTKNFLIVSNGGLSHDSLKSFVEVNFANFSSTSSSQSTPSNYIGGDIRVRRLDLDGQSYLGLALPFNVENGASQDNQVLSKVLEYKLKELNTSTIKPFFKLYSTGGLIGFTVQGSAIEATQQFNDALQQLKNISSVTDDLINKIVKDLKLAKALKIENENDALSLLTDSGFVNLNSVTAVSVSKAATDLLKSKPSYAVLGVTFGTPSYDTVRTNLVV